MRHFYSLDAATGKFTPLLNFPTVPLLVKQLKAPPSETLLPTDLICCGNAMVEKRTIPLSVKVRQEGVIINGPEQETIPRG